MKGLIISLAIVGLGLSGCGAGKEASGEPPGPGDPAPSFELPGSDGKTHRLADHEGARAVVIAWFPKAFTGG